MFVCDAPRAIIETRTPLMTAVPAVLSSSGVAPLLREADRTRRIVHVDAFARLEEAAPAWERLAAADTVATPFADLDWIGAWQRHVGEPHGSEPLVVVARDEFDAPLLALPFAVSRGCRCTVARWFGGTHSHLNMGLWRRDVAGAMTAEKLRALLAEVAARRGIDLFMLRNQPFGWDGCGNPFALLPHQRASDDVYRLSFDGLTGDQLLKARLNPNTRGNLKKKEQKLAKLDGYRCFRAATAAEVDRVLDAFLVQKAAHFAEHGVRNVFAEPGTDAFLREACKRGLGDGRPAIELHAIEGGGELLAILGGVAGRRRFAAMFNSYTLTEHARWSPGLVIVAHVIRDCAARGLASFDLGVGFASYKWFFCKEVDPLFDSLLPFTAAGRLAAAFCRPTLALKRWIKTTPPVWNALQAARRVLR
jgi:CelD/BcsL family acetyltransferase involved in cellulose biosynthesis